MRCAPLRVAIVEATDGVVADLDDARREFQRLSDAMVQLEQSFGHDGGATHYVIHCPMAFGNTGADWLQTSTQIANPSFGASMLRCGEVRATHESVE